MRYLMIFLSFTVASAFAASASAEDPLPIGKVAVVRHENVYTSAPAQSHEPRVRYIVVQEYVPVVPNYRHGVGFGWNFYAGRLHPHHCSPFPQRLGGQIGFYVW